MKKLLGTIIGVALLTAPSAAFAQSYGYTPAYGYYPAYGYTAAYGYPSSNYGGSGMVYSGQVNSCDYNSGVYSFGPCPSKYSNYYPQQYYQPTYYTQPTYGYAQPSYYYPQTSYYTPQYSYPYYSTQQISIDNSIHNNGYSQPYAYFW